MVAFTSLSNLNYNPFANVKGQTCKVDTFLAIHQNSDLKQHVKSVYIATYIKMCVCTCMCAWIYVQTSL